MDFSTLTKLTATVLCSFSVSAYASVSLTEVPQGLTVQGRIIQPNGLPLEDSHVSFNIKVLSPGPEACVLFEENRTVNMSNSKGIINFTLGAGENGATVVNTGPLLAIHQILKNSAAINGLSSCAAGYTAYVPQPGDARKVRVTFTVGSDTITLSPDFQMRSVPFALESENAVALNGKKAADFIQKSANVTQEKADTLFLPANFDGLLALLNPAANAPSVGSIGIPNSDGSAAPPARDGLMRYDENTQTVQVSVGGQWQPIVTGNTAVGSSNIEDGSIGTADLAPNAVTAAQITNNAVTTDKIADEAITSDKLMNMSITNSKIADGAITFNKIANGAISTSKIVDSAITSAKILDGSIVTADMADAAITSAKIADGTIVTSDVADAAITSAKIEDGTIVTSDIADAAINSAKIADGSIATADMANSAVTTAKIADGNVTDAKINSVSGSKVTGNIPGNAAGFYGSLSGDVTGGQASTVVQALQGRSVANVGPGAGQVLKWNGSQWTPQADNNSGGTITGVWPSTGLTGGGGSGSVSLGLTNTGVAAGWYGGSTAVPSFYVDSQGRITSVSNVAVAAGAACGGTPHGRVYFSGGTCSSVGIYQCFNGSTLSLGTVSVPSSCDGDGDGF
ncbi:hypothetical protein AB1A81_13185 [Bdellovibrio bacteriovorus]|uniref:Cell wall surface anchor family protein n=1 Tax=Bdellovibrio bacteriovorus (strain ATCC 15356 / DSM 50701 / NCIMB 9529 / HD100) TaxID=264462 RepID=Q6MJA9_BDEBA|nr:hypothetical protein [Bdellovibrio bacteriovorus]AHZ85359.1 hypothetical protein EP01_10470 [Bdellovibrio bacteriovorus]BEV69253.1 hypothetical protein Bb109J_c2673 [Bdellovibrio bacteriovorus]CAE80652.1 hypothetical protein predicted by Glimmer/Critica [Bdellovibrio bacteriovorus HD100]